MLKGHLPRVIYHPVYYYTKIRNAGRTPASSFFRSHTSKKQCFLCEPFLMDEVPLYTYRSTSLIRNRPPPLGSYSRPLPRALVWSLGGGSLLGTRYPMVVLGRARRKGQGSENSEAEK